ncbi:MAG: hypothetical protein ACYSU3_13385 [Planctomycetota bacterium]
MPDGLFSGAPNVALESEQAAAGLVDLQLFAIELIDIDAETQSKFGFHTLIPFRAFSAVALED